MKWEITKLFARKIYNNFSNVVESVSWKCSHEYQLNGKTCEETRIGTSRISLPDETSFIVFNKLTQDDVLQWVFESGIDKNSIENDLIKSADNKINQPVVAMDNPW